MNASSERQNAVNSMTLDVTARTAAGDALSGLVVRVLRLHGLLSAAGDALARPTGQTSARWQVLAMIEHEPHTVAETARTLGLARQSVQRVADLLEAEGLVSYGDNPRHRRARLLTLTEPGRATLEAIQRAQRPWANAVGAAAGERRLRRLNADLDRVLEALSSRGRLESPAAADPRRSRASGRTGRG